MKKDYQKALTKLNLFFLSNQAPFNGQKYQKQTRPETNGESLFTLQNKVKIIPFFSLVMYYLTKCDDFWVIPKFLNLCKPFHDVMNYSTSICPFEFRKCGKEKRNYKKFNILRTKRTFSMK